MVGTGPGYRFWDDELGRFDLIGQFNPVRLESDVADLAFNTTSLELDYKRLLWGTRLEFYANAELQNPHIAEIDYVRDSEMACATASTSGRGCRCSMSSINWRPRVRGFLTDIT